jgi:predicted ATPase
MRLGLELSDALTRAHHLRIIHRDIKPANVLIAADGTPRLTDFGVARLDNEERMTQSGVAIGTLDYIAPEGLNGVVDDPRSDIWSFGVMLFELLTGQRPFTGKNISQIVKSILVDTPPDLERLRPDAPIGLVDLIGRMLQKDPSDRIGSIRLVGAELENLLAKQVGDAPVMPRITTETPRPIAIRHNLPADTTLFVGRDTELTELRRLVTSSRIRLVTIVAQGGMGKTRLALELGHQFAGLIHETDLNTEQRIHWQHGVFFVALAPLHNPDDIIGAIGNAVGYTFQTGEENKAQLQTFLSDKHLLLILDNFEHLLAGATLVDDLLTHAPNIKIIVTSRARLNLTSENLFTLEGMDFPDWETPEDALTYSAVKLFMQSAVRARPDFELHPEHLAYVARICRLVDGLPLAILLAASWIEMLSPQEIADEISKSLDFLQSNMRDLPERHQSIRAVFDYSWNLLDATERIAFMNLAIFSGGFTREAAQKAVGASLRVLAGLVNASLIRRSPNSGRYDVHELLRQYAEERLKHSGRYEAVYADYARYYLHFLAEREADLQGKRQLGALDEIGADIENIRQAWRWAVEHHRADLLAPSLESLHLFGLMRSYQAWGKKLFTTARQTFTQTAYPALWAKLTVRFPDVGEDIQDIYRTCLQIAREHGDKCEAGYCLRMLGVSLAHHDENMTDGLPILEQALALFQSINADFYAAQVMDDIAFAYTIIGDANNHRKYGEMCLALRRKIGDIVRTADVILNLASTYILVGDFRDIISAYQEAEKIYRMTNNLAGLSHSYGLQAYTHLQLGQRDLALEKARLAYDIARDVRDIEGIIYGADVLCVWHIIDGDIAQGKAYHHEVITLASKVYYPLFPPEWTHALIAVIDQRYDEVMPFIRQRLQGVRESNRPNLGIVAILFYFIMQTQKGIATHADLQRMSSADQFIHSAYGGSWLDHWKIYQDAQATLKTTWGEATYNAIWARGDADTILSQLLTWAEAML